MTSILPRVKRYPPRVEPASNPLMIWPHLAITAPFNSSLILLVSGKSLPFLIASMMMHDDVNSLLSLEEESTTGSSSLVGNPFTTWASLAKSQRVVTANSTRLSERQTSPFGG